LAYGTVAIAKPTDPANRILGIVLDDERGLSLEETRDLVVRLHGLVEQMSPAPGIRTQEELDAWTQEILPFLDYEHVTDGYVFVPDVEFKWRNDDMAFHILGQAACGPLSGKERLVVLNGRFTTAQPPWSEYVYITLIHELIHMQLGPYCTGTSAELEANTVIASMEVAAAMVNRGDPVMLRPWLLEMEDMGMATIRYYDPDGYEAFWHELNPTPADEARIYKSERFWESDNPNGLQDILYKYNVVPWLALTDGALSGYAVNYPTLTLPVDDLAYLLEHADEMTPA
jgi:hypothetical protein